MLKQEIDTFRDEIREFQKHCTEKEDILNTKLALIRLENNELKSRAIGNQKEINELQNKINEEISERKSILKELELANEIIFQNQKSFDINDSVRINDTGDGILTLQKKLQKLMKRLEENSNLLVEEKKQHEESVRALLEADKKNEEFSKKLVSAENEIGYKDKEIKEFTLIIGAFNKKIQEMRNIQQKQLEYYDGVISQFSKKELENLKALEQMQEYEKTIAENAQVMLQNKVTIEELHEIVEESKSDMNVYEAKVKKLEASVAKKNLNFNKHLESKNKQIVELSRELYTLKQNIKQNKDRSGTEPRESDYKHNRIYENELNSGKISRDAYAYQDFSESIDSSSNSSLKYSEDKLNSLFKELIVMLASENLPDIEEKLELIGKIKHECQENIVLATNSLNFEDLYDSLIREFEEYKTVTEVLEQRIDVLTAENAELRISLEKINSSPKNPAKSPTNLEQMRRSTPEADDFVTFQSLSLDQQVSLIDFPDNPYAERVRVLEEENQMLVESLERIKDSWNSLKYSTSEEEPTYRRNLSEELTGTWLEKIRESSTQTSKKSAPKGNENILVIDMGEAESESHSGLALPDADLGPNNSGLRNR